jgi:WD40 repeat protein
VTAHRHGRVKVTDLASAATSHTFVTTPARPLPGTGAYYAPGRAPNPGEPEPIRDLTAGIGPDGCTVAVALGWDGWIHRWDAITGDELTKTFLGGPGVRVRCARLDGQVRLLVGTNSHLMVYDLGSGQPIASHELTLGWGLRLLDTVGELVATVDGDQHLHRWRLHDAGAALESLGGPEVAHHGQIDALCCGRLSDGRPVAATGAQDGAIRVWDLADGRLLHHIPLEVPPIVNTLADGADLLVGVFGGLAVFHLT